MNIQKLDTQFTTAQPNRTSIVKVDDSKPSFDIVVSPGVESDTAEVRAEWASGSARTVRILDGSLSGAVLVTFPVIASTAGSGFCALYNDGAAWAVKFSLQS